MDFGKELNKQKAKQKKQLEKDIMKAIKNKSFRFKYKNIPSEDLIFNYVEAAKEIDKELRKSGFCLNINYGIIDFDVVIERVDREEFL